MTKKRITVLVASLFAATALVVTAPRPVEATCSQAYVYFYEDLNLNGDRILFCYPNNVPYFANVPHTQPGVCNSGWIRFGDHWDDCISSALYENGTLNTTLCTYLDRDYHGLINKFTADGTKNYNNVWQYGDMMSSAKWAC